MVAEQCKDAFAYLSYMLQVTVQLDTSMTDTLKVVSAIQAVDSSYTAEVLPFRYSTYFSADRPSSND
jgi:hypothetical protein